MFIYLYFTHLVFNLSGPGSVLESVVGVLEGEAGGGNICDHHSAAISSKRSFQKSSQFGVSVWDVLLALGQSIDAVSCKIDNN